MEVVVLETISRSQDGLKISGKIETIVVTCENTEKCSGNLRRFLSLKTNNLKSYMISNIPV